MMVVFMKTLAAILHKRNQIEVCHSRDDIDIKWTSNEMALENPRTIPRSLRMDISSNSIVVEQAPSQLILRVLYLLNCCFDTFASCRLLLRLRDL